MNNTLKRLDAFADAIDFSTGITNPAIVGALTNINNVVRGSAEVVSFAEGFADHVLDNGTIQTSVLFKNGVPKDKSAIISTVIDLLVSFALFYIGKRKIGQGNVSQMVAGNSSDHNVESWGRGQNQNRVGTDSAKEADQGNFDAAEQLISVVNDIIETKNYDAFDDAITGLQYQLMNTFKL